MDTPTLNPPETVQVNFTLAIDEARIQASVEVPAREVTVTQMLPVLQNLTSGVVNQAIAHVEAGPYRVSCKAGCAACCRQLVPLSIFEAEAFAQWIRSLPEHQQSELQQRFHLALLQLRDSGVLARLTPELWEEGSPESLHALIDYQAAKVACPFLEDERCSIHPIRPLVCREYLVTSPPEYCWDPTGGRVSGVRIPLKLSKALIRLGAKLEEDPNGWIPLVFLFEWMKSGATPGSRMSGPGPQVLGGVLAELR